MGVFLGRKLGPVASGFKDVFYFSTSDFFSSFGASGLRGFVTIGGVGSAGAAEDIDTFGSGDFISFCFGG